MAISKFDTVTLLKRNYILHEHNEQLSRTVRNVHKHVMKIIKDARIKFY